MMIGAQVTWNPDDKWFMFMTYGRRKADAAFKRLMLIGEDKFSPDHLQVLGDDAEQIKRIADSSGKDKTRKDRGWGGVSWKTYGDILKALQKRQRDQTVSLFFEFPVHAFGYNWTASNDLAGKRLADEIPKIMKGYKDKGRYCDKVILVTHSMGGLVARCAYMLHGANDKILGIVHGSQPSNGSPAAYWRMKGGFERPHSVPDLDLMQWLELIGEDGSRNALPRSDPYKEIYQKQTAYYRLVNPEWLNPGKKEQTGQKGLKKPTSTWNLYLGYLDQAKTFHDKLIENDLHPESYQFYSSGIASADRVVLKAADDTFRNTVNHKLGIGKKPPGSASDRSVTGYLQDVTNWMIFGSIKGVMDVKDLLADWYFSRGGYRDHLRMDGEDLSKEGRIHMVTLQLPDGAKDGMVPESSTMALELKSDKKRTFCIADQREFEDKSFENNPLKPKILPDFDEGYFDRGHESIYKTSSAQFVSFTAIENICRAGIRNLLEGKVTVLPTHIVDHFQMR